jgi:hypothetical protein
MPRAITPHLTLYAYNIWGLIRIHRGNFTLTLFWTLYCLNFSLCCQNYCLWYVIPCSLVEKYYCFGKAGCFHCQSSFFMFALSFWGRPEMKLDDSYSLDSVPPLMWSAIFRVISQEHCWCTMALGPLGTFTLKIMAIIHRFAEMSILTLLLVGTLDVRGFRNLCMFVQCICNWIFPLRQNTQNSNIVL